MKKSGRKSGRTRPGTFTGRNDPRNGRGPAKGQGGRPPDAFRAWCQQIMESVPVAGVRQQRYTRSGREELVRLAFRATDERVRFNALRYIGVHAYGQPEQPGDVDRPMVIKLVDVYADGRSVVREVSRQALGVPGAVH